MACPCIHLRVGWRLGDGLTTSPQEPLLVMETSQEALRPTWRGDRMTMSVVDTDDFIDFPL